MKKAVMLLLVVVTLVFAQPARSYADEQLYQVSMSHAEEALAGIPNAPWGIFMAESRNKVIENVRQMPAGIDNWTDNQISNSLLKDFLVTPATRARLSENLMNLEKKYLGTVADDGGEQLPSGEEQLPSNPDTDAVPVVTSADIYGSDLQQAEQNASFPEKIAAQVVISLPNYLINVLHLQEPVALIYQEVPDSIKKTPLEPRAFVPPEDLYFYTFHPEEFQAVAILYETLKAYLAIVLVLLLVFIGAALYFSAWGEQRANLRGYALGVLVALLAVQFAPYLWRIAFDVNRAIVMMFRSSFANIPPMSFFHMLWQPDTVSLGMAIVSFVAAIGVGALNWQYIMRKLTLAVLLFSFPLVVVIAIWRRQVLDIWLREFVSNIFLQAAHAGAYAFFILFTANAGNTPDFWWYAMAFIIGINGIAGLVRRLIGAETVGGGMSSAVGAAVGLGSFMALGRMAMLGMGTGLGRSAGQKLGLLDGGGSSGGEGGGGMPPAGPAPGRGGGGSAGGATPAIGLAGASWGSRGKVLGLKGLNQAARVAGMGAQFMGLTTGAVAGAMLSGALGGNAAAGLSVGASLGAIAGDRVQSKIQGFGEQAEAIGNEHLLTGEGISGIARRRAGIYDAAQVMDPRNMAALGQKVFSHPGAITGYAVGLAARDVSHMSGRGGPARERADAMRRYQDQNTIQIAAGRYDLQTALPELNLAKEKLSYAQSAFGKGSSEYRSAQDDYDEKSARASELKIQQMNALSRLSNRSLEREFSRLREQRAVTGDQDGFSGIWRK